MYNNTKGLQPSKPTPAKTLTTFTDLATNKEYTLLVEPSERQVTFSTEYSKLPVVGTAYPLLAYKSSEKVISFPDVKFWTFGNTQDIGPVLADIASLTQPTKDTLEPPVLKLTMGSEVVDRVRLSKFSYKVKLQLGNVITMAEGSIEVVIDPKPAVLTVVGPEVTAPKLSAPEQASSATKVKVLLEQDPIKAKLYSYTKVKSTVSVNEAGQVLVDNKVVGLLKDVLGDATPPGLNSGLLTADGKKKLSFPAPGKVTTK